MFSYSSIEHMGLMTFAFGLGGPLATFGALHAHDGAFADQVGHLRDRRSCHPDRRHPAIEHIRGLIRTQPTIGWGLLIGTAAIAGFPPFGVFTSEFLVLTATMQH